jgi:hypothetical protein
VISCKRIKRIKLAKALIVAESQIYESPALKTTKNENQACNSFDCCSISHFANLWLKKESHAKEEREAGC